MTSTGLLVLASGFIVMTIALTPEVRRRLQGLYYGWWLTGIAALIMVLGAVPLFQGMTAWFVALEHQFGWSRTQLSLAFSLTRVEGTIMGPVAGYMTDKVGTRRIVLIGMLVSGVGFFLLGRVQTLWQFYAVFVLMSVGSGLGTWLPSMTVINNWFNRHRATAMAMASTGFSLGGVLLIPALAWAIDPAHPGRLGWSLTAQGIGIVIICLAIPLSLLVRNRPEDYGQRVDGLPPEPASTGVTVRKSRRDDEDDYTWQQAVRTRSFWLITMGHSCASMLFGTMMVHMGPMLVNDQGLSLSTVGLVVGAFTGVSAIFNIVGGYIGDRVPIRLAIFGFSTVQALSVFVILVAHNVEIAFLFAAVFGIGFGGRSPLTTAVRGVYFGRKAFASITGVSMIPMNLMLLVAPLFAGIMFDVRGSYTIPFITLAIVSLLGSSLFLFLGDPVPLSQVRSRRPQLAV